VTNLVVVVADDMRHDHVQYMPNLQRWLTDRGTTFTEARCNLPVCQPARVGLMSGQLSRDHGDIEVGFEGSVFEAHDNTVAAWIAGAGYRCGLFGKYINGVDELGGIDAPVGWSRWEQFTDDHSQEDFTVRRDRQGKVRVRGKYQTEHLGDRTAEFIAAGPTPFFAYLAPRHAHAPVSPHPDDLHAWTYERCLEVPLLDASTKPPWVQELPVLTDADWSKVQRNFRGRLRELNALDRMLATVMEALDAEGALDDTIVVFTSDNGVHQGEQRRQGDATKGGPYEVGLHVPLIAAGPGFGAGTQVDDPVYAHQDITATLLDVAGVTAGLPRQAGLSLRAIAADPASFAQRALLHESIAEGGLRDGDGVTTGPRHALGHWKLFRYPSARRGTPPTHYELYDLAADPDELVNLADVPAQRANRDLLEGLLDGLLTQA
jgi:arylsulfatase A-like enzyme